MAALIARTGMARLPMAAVPSAVLPALGTLPEAGSTP